ncbi:MAG: DUF3244 domain-containing protein [Bacteroidales bacterium]|nr:DUF3244 domain-containing protein [Bacteroidales bacterium]
MTRFGFNGIILLVMGLFLTSTLFSKQVSIPDETMPDYYVGIEIKEETQTNPHRSLIPEIVAYYYMKEVVLEMNVPLDDLTVEIINTSNGRMKVECLDSQDYTSSINISEMGTGSYVIYITINSNLRFFGALELY